MQVPAEGSRRSLYGDQMQVPQAKLEAHPVRMPYQEVSFAPHFANLWLHRQMSDISGSFRTLMSNSRRAKMSDVLYEDILGRIDGGEFAPDDRLPSEKELCERFGVSRPIVREALERLRHDGLIRSRQGAGSFVTGKKAIETAAGAEPRPQLPAQIDSIMAVQHFYDFRIALEGEIASIAAINRREDDILRIGSFLQDIKSFQGNKVAGVEADLAFHAAIAAATHNEFFVEAWEAARAHIRFIIEMARNFLPLKVNHYSEVVKSSHEPIFEYIRDGNSGMAREKMREHLSLSRERVFFGEQSR